MLQNKVQSIEAIQTIARSLGELNERVVYVGGAVAGLYIDDSGAPEIRPTKDVDVVVEIASAFELEDFRQELARRDIQFTPDEKVMCRFKYQNILLDVMATKEVGWAPANTWFKSGYDHSEMRHLDDVEIKIMPFPYYLASKFVAFKDRGKDPRTSHDFEDIIYVLDNRSDLVRDILGSEQAVKTFLIVEFINILSLQEAVLGHLEPATQTVRFDILNQKIQEIIARQSEKKPH